MKFFRPEIVNSIPKHRKACKDYWAYYRSIRDRIPKGLSKLQEMWILHDAVIERIEFDPDRPDVSMVLCGNSFDDLVDGSLCFKGVFHLDVRCSTMKEETFVKLYALWGGVSQSEIELLGDGKFEIRLLMHRGAELTIGFRDMTNRLRIHRTKAGAANRRRTVAYLQEVEKTASPAPKNQRRR